MFWPTTELPSGIYNHLRVTQYLTKPSKIQTKSKYKIFLENWKMVKEKSLPNWNIMDNIIRKKFNIDFTCWTKSQIAPLVIQYLLNCEPLIGLNCKNFPQQRQLKCWKLLPRCYWRPRGIFLPHQKILARSRWFIPWQFWVTQCTHQKKKEREREKFNFFCSLQYEENCKTMEQIIH